MKYYERAVRYANDMKEEFDNCYYAFHRFTSYDTKVDNMKKRSINGHEDDQEKIIEDAFSIRNQQRSALESLIKNMILFVCRKYNPDFMHKIIDDPRLLKYL